MPPNGNARLDGRQMELLADGLLSAFDPNTLARMLRFKLDERLDMIVDQRANFTDQVWLLLQWAERTGKVQELLRAAVQAVPGNPQLRDAVETA